MAIPKIIHQTFKTAQLPYITRWHINKFRKKNPGYTYEFYDDERIESFLSEEFTPDVLHAYKRLNIGAAKADMFRYAILYKKGGVYLDIDSTIIGKLDNFIRPGDKAIISRERNHGIYVQWALIYEPDHPFLKKTLEKIVENISINKYPNDVHSLTGPGIYTEAINECLRENPSVSYRILGTDYEGHLKFKYNFGKLFLYKKGEHWKKQQTIKPLLKEL